MRTAAVLACVLALAACSKSRQKRAGDAAPVEVVPLRKGKIFKMKGEIKVDNQVVSQAEFLAGLAEKSKVA